MYDRRAKMAFCGGGGTDADEDDFTIVLVECLLLQQARAVVSSCVVDRSCQSQVQVL